MSNITLYVHHWSGRHPRDWPSFDALLSSEEASRADRMAFHSDREQFRVAHALKRLTLSEHAPDMPPADWRFTTNKHGRPFLSPPYALDFNLAHTHGCVACVIGNDASVGVDVEPLHREVDDQVKEAVLTLNEKKWLSESSPKNRRRDFMRLWTAKEAILKAAGFGLSLPLTSVAFDLRKMAVEFVEFRIGGQSDWQICQFLVCKSHVISVAWRSDNRVSQVDARCSHFASQQSASEALAGGATRVMLAGNDSSSSNQCLTQIS